MARIIVIANQKGGVGKTTTAVNLGVALAKFGHRVAIMDLDSQGALTVNFGLDPYEVKPSTHDLLVGESTAFSDVVHKRQLEFQLGGKAEIAVLPANAELVSAEYKLLKLSGRTTRLKKALNPAEEDYDYIVLDTPPGLGLLTVNGLVAGDELLIPVATDYLAMRGVRALLESVWLIRSRANPALKLLGLVPTLYRPESSHSDAVVAEMRKVFKHKVSKTIIPVDEAASAAPAARKSVIEYQPESAAAKAYLQLAEEVHNARRS